MTIEWHGDAKLREIRQAAANDLLRAAIFFRNQHAIRISRPNPAPHDNPSKPGEYLKVATGAGLANLTMTPDSLAEVMRSLKVRVGFRRNAWYMLYWELAAHSVRLRLGLQTTLADLRDQLAELAVASFKK